MNSADGKPEWKFEINGSGFESEVSYKGEPVSWITKIKIEVDSTSLSAATVGIDFVAAEIMVAGKDVDLVGKKSVLETIAMLAKTQLLTTEEIKDAAGIT